MAASPRAICQDAAVAEELQVLDLTPDVAQGKPDLAKRFVVEPGKRLKLSKRGLPRTPTDIDDWSSRKY